MQIAFGINQFETLASLTGNDNDSLGKIWNCPSRNFETNTSDLYGQIIIGYQYMGGISRWRNPQGSFRSRSPITLHNSEPDWVLAADTTAKIDEEWGGGRSTAYGDMPSHKLGNTLYPEGSNQVYVDGSVEWVEFLDMSFVHCWTTKNRAFYMYQRDLGNFDPNENSQAQY